MKLSLTLILMVGTVMVGLGQTAKPRPDPTGTWEFDRVRRLVAKSHKSPPEQIKITFVDPELKIRRQVPINGVLEERELTYYTDGRGETNPTTGWMTTDPDAQSIAPAVTKSKTGWSREKIVTQSSERSYLGGAIFDYETVQEWRLSSDGKTLTQTTRSVIKTPPINTPMFGNATEFKAVYKLISK